MLDYTVLTAGKIKIVIDDDLGRPCSERDNKFLVGDCGRIARTYTPFNLKSFTAIDSEKYESLIMRLQVKFEWDRECPKAELFMYQTLGRAYNGWKSMYARRILKHADPKDAIKEKHVDISDSDWKWWVEYVHSTEYKEISQRNAANRAQQNYTHRAGSKAFVFHTVSPEGSDTKIGFLEMFKSTHWSAKDGWISELAEDQYKEMRRIVEESELDPNGPISEFEAGQMVLGRKSGYVRGMGRSVRPPPKISPLQMKQASKIKSLENELNEMQLKVKAQDEKMKAQDKKMAKIFEMMEIMQHNGNVNSPGAGHSRDGSHSPFGPALNPNEF